ncbi:SRPBCC family protein [Leptolyngbya sp. O-77]|uniref:SRPBCC family protein n=1 Tax=Leptolyngbya sp. O-77 TaxID=1080068 RepID=UPI00074D4478|nr:SRPBCC family protein [Leptolyngbya sp. O-77]BAU44210.1 Polyketide cyclase / dehydrase and lipid transport [Leptolyngbya sp. O-77]
MKISLQFGWTRLTALLSASAVLTSALGTGLAAAPTIARQSLPAAEASSNAPAASLRLPDAVATAPGVTISGENGRFVGQVVINGSAAAAWAVLTDYNNFASFLPNVESSRLLSRNGNQVTFEQVNVLRVASVPVRNRVTVASSEQRPSQIQFVVMDGNEPIMQGVWQLQQASARQLVLTHQVVISPRSDLMRDVYSRVYRGELETTLVSLRREIERRSR